MGLYFNFLGVLVLVGSRLFFVLDLFVGLSKVEGALGIQEEADPMQVQLHLMRQLVYVDVRLIAPPEEVHEV